MRKKSKSKGKTTQSALTKNIIGIILSSVISFVILSVMTAVIALILLKSESVADSYIMYLYFSTVISAFIGGFISSKSCTLKGIFSGLISSVAFNLLLTVILLFASKGQIRADTGILYAVSTLFFVLGGIAGANTKRRK